MIYKCEKCDYETSRLFNMKKHRKSKYHLENMKSDEPYSKYSKFYCEYCDKLFDNKSNYLIHTSRNYHKKIVGTY